MTNISSYIENSLHAEHLRLIREAARVSEEQGVSLYLVGGTVRDLLMGKTPLDIDITMVGANASFADRLASSVGGQIVSRSQFGTSKLDLGGVIVDLAMARSETYAHPGALPSVTQGTLRQDLTRRDFTINAMAASLVSDSWGDLIDLFDGQTDLRSGLIRILHAASFRDDATRVLRALRYAGRLKFELEERTKTAFGRDLGYLDTIKGDRVRHELERIFVEDDAPLILRSLRDTGVLASIYPNLAISDAALSAFAARDPDSIADRHLVFAALLAYPIPSNMLEGFISRLNMNRDWARTVRDTAVLSVRTETLRDPGLKPSQIFHALHNLDPHAVMAWSDSTGSSIVKERIDFYVSDLRMVKPALDGDDLISIGVPAGPELGKLLADLLVARLDDVVISRHDEITFVREWLASRYSSQA